VGNHFKYAATSHQSIFYHISEYRLDHQNDHALKKNSSVFDCLEWPGLDCQKDPQNDFRVRGAVVDHLALNLDS
jgi:hypothetical protein